MTCFFIVIFLTVIFFAYFPRIFQTVQSHKQRACPCLSDFCPSVHPNGDICAYYPECLVCCRLAEEWLCRFGLAFADLSLRCTFIWKNKRQRGNKITGEGEIRRCLHPSNASLRDKPIWPRCWWVIATGDYFSRLAKLASVIQLCLCFPNVSVLDPSVQHRGNIIWGPHTQTKSTFLFDLKAFGVFKAHWLTSLGGFY